MTETETKKSKKSSHNERFMPFLVIVIAVLSFAVGILWQKVNNLESPSSNNKVADNQQDSAAEEPSVLDDLPALAKASGVDVNDFNNCMKAGDTETVVNDDYQSGVAAGVTGTPSNFLVNKATGDIWAIPGAVPYDTLSQVIDVALGNSDEDATTLEKLSDEDAARVEMPSDSDHMLGDPAGSVYLIEYSDFQCPYCQRFDPTVKQAVEDYENQLILVYRHFPLDQIHPNARPAAIASECVADLGGDEAFWKFVDLVFGAN